MGIQPPQHRVATGWRAVADHIWLTPAERFLGHHWLSVVAVLSTVLLLNEWLYFGSQASEWDWLLISGAALLFALYPASLSLPDRAEKSVERLVHGHALYRGDAAIVEAWPVVLSLHARAFRWARWCAIAAFGLMLIAWVWARSGTPRWWEDPPQLLLAVLELVGAALVGLFVGRAIGYGRLGRALAAEGVSVRARPGHPDGAGGLWPVGALFLFQASLLAAIALYLGVWWLLIPRFPAYWEWRDAYVLLLVFVVLFSFLGFLLPLLWFHARMSEQKRTLLEEAEEAAADAIGRREAALAANADEARRAAEARVELEVRRYDEIQAMPTWPVDRRIRRRFAYNQVLVFAPLLLKGLSADWADFWNAVGQWLLGGDS